MNTASLNTESHYLCLSVSPSVASELAIRKTIADALTETFGVTSTSTYLDLLWLKDDGSECIIRAHKSDATKISIAIASWTETPRMAVKQQSPFLPSLLRTDITL
ncbi:hypothetical protein JR316_0010778 [Psilocybe cubensis]|uniref:Uncharacterized protein n=1 Tax=Psilocybe cubensis TaxID=181762 RepID=A0ACB8GNB1_PSICU|nr:hypothetical protein JR316_0010778 [Psilocybe cubensis]KAH9476862.1 hypothetical protein JR316_0010778 [Psilocybe cubensis]